MDIKSLQKLAGLNEATVNISMTGANSAEISDLMNMFKGPEPKPISIGGPPPPPPGLDIPGGPPPGLDIPDIKPPIGLDKPVPMGIDGPMPPLPPPKPLGMDDGPAPCDTCGGIHGDEPCGEDTSWDNGPDEKYLDADHMTNGVSGGINGRKNPKDIRVKDGSSMEQTKESMKESYKKELWNALQEKYFTQFDGRKTESAPSPAGMSRSDLKKLKMTNPKKYYLLMRQAKQEMNPIKQSMYSEEQTFSGRSDRTFFVVPNEEDYMDIQNDNRFAGDIEVPDENADIMALPNSKARKLKMMFGDKVEFLGTDYDEALAQVSQEEGYQTTPEKDLVGKQNKLPNEVKAKILSAPEDGEEDSENNSMYDEEMNRIRKLSGLQNEEDNKKPDEDGDGVPDWADKKPGEDDAEKKKARRRHLANVSRTKARGRK